MIYWYLTISLVLSPRPANGEFNGSTGSLVWGTSGEKWNRHRLMDWSSSGYGGKERDLPDPPVVANVVVDFGATGDGVVDDTAPLLAALANASAAGGGTVFLPPGRFLVTQRIVLSASGVVLKGAGAGATTIYSPKTLAEIDGKNASSWAPLPGFQSPYTWSDGLVQISGTDAGSADRSTRIGVVSRAAAAGTRSLVLNSTAGLIPGQWVRLLQSDFNGTLMEDMYFSAISKSACGAACGAKLAGENDMVRWMTRVVAVDGRTVTLQRPLPVNVHPRWRAELHRIPASMPRESGVRDLSIEFGWAPAAPHHLEPGRNALAVVHAVNSFVSNVAVLNVDAGIIVSGALMISVDGFTAGDTLPRGGDRPFSGHIGIGVDTSSDVEVANFRLNGEWLHDVSVRGTLLAAIHAGSGANLVLDFHRSAPYATLCSDIDLGAAGRPFGTGGYPSRGFPAAAYTTYYNLRSAAGTAQQLPAHTYQGNCTWGAFLNFVGAWAGPRCDSYYVEEFAPGTLQPADLYASMLERKQAARQAQRPQVQGVQLVGEGVVVTTSLAAAAALAPTPAAAPGAAPAFLRPDAKVVVVPPAGGDGTYPAIDAPETY